jgi:hypothetical protein
MKHPTHATVEAYCNGDVAHATVRHIEEHIRECGECALDIATTVRSPIAERHRELADNRGSRKADSSDAEQEGSRGRGRREVPALS